MKDIYIVEWENDILGNGKKEMTLAEIEQFNSAAYSCAIVSEGNEGKPASLGMWTVYMKEKP